MNLSISQSEITELTGELSRFTQEVDDFGDGMIDKGAFLRDVRQYESMDWSKENLFNQLLGYFALANAYGQLKSKTLDYTQAYYDSEYIYKEVSYYHNIQYIVSRIAKEQWAALYLNAFSISCRSYLSLANAYDHLGRFCEARQYYREAARDRRNVADVEFNQGFCYANIHAFWTEEEPWIVRKAQQLLTKYAERYDEQAPGLRAKVCSWPVPSFDVPLADYGIMPECEYEYWVNSNFLRLNRFCDIEPLSQLSVADNVKLKDIWDTKERKELFTSSFDEIKQTFIDSRKLVFSAIGSTNNVDVVLLKMTYKSFYSILDKIALFLQAYLNIPIETYKTDFASIWTDKKNNIRSEFLAHSQNLSLLALYNIKLDVYGSKSFKYVIDEQTKDLQRVRNFIEHKIVIEQDGPMIYDEYRLKISKSELTIDTVRLAQLVRCAIIYLCNFVMHAEYDKINNLKKRRQ